MFKQTVEYVDFNGVERKEDLYFHLSRPEVARIEARFATKDSEKTIKEIIEEMVADAKVKELLDFMEGLILDSYGKKSSDGRSFVKNKELREEFEYSIAYAEMFELLLAKEGLAQKFGEQVADNGHVKRNQVTPNVQEAPPSKNS